MNIPAWASYVMKAVAAFVTVIISGIIAGAIGAPEWVTYALQAFLAALAVFGVTNGPKPE